MDANILDPDAARERVAAWKGRIDKLAADTQQMSDRLSEVRVTVRDPGQLAEVTVDSTGSLVDLRLTDQMYRATPAAVAQAIMATLAQARTKVADRTQEIIADTMGSESAAGRAIADRVGQQLRGGPPADRSDRPRDTGDDEGYDTHSYLDDP
jgi:DNA-binding protein YbaB